MPHFELSRDELDERYPSLSAPVEVPAEDETKWETWDRIYQRGLEIVEEIRGRMVEVGRRRCDANVACGDVERMSQTEDG